MFYVDLDELDQVAGEISLFSHNRRNLYSFYDTDHEPSGTGPLRKRIVDYLKGNNVALHPRGRVMLLTLPRVLGYIFNPISIYFCFEENGTPLCAIAEVGNTFREMKLFLIRGDELIDGNIFSQEMPKYFYVSPFSRLDLNFHFRLRIPAEKLNIEIDDHEGDQKILASKLTGSSLPLTNKNLLWLTAKFPFLTLKVIFLIHWQAFKLWMKKVPFYRKAENCELQREVLRAHSTLTTKTK